MNKEKTLTMLNKIIYIGMIVFAGVLFMPISVISTVSVFLLLTWIIKIVLVKAENMELSSLKIPIFIFLGFTVLSIIFSVDILRSLCGLKKELLVLVFFVVINNINDEEQLKKMIKWLIIGTVAISLFGLFQYVLGINRLEGKIDVPFKMLSHLPGKVLKFLSLYDHRVTGSRDHPISFAGGLVMGGSLVLSLFLFGDGSKKNKVFLGLGGLIIAMCLLFTYSRGAWLAGLTSLILIEVIGFIKFFPSTKINKILIPSTLIVLVAVIFAAGFISSFTNNSKYSVFSRAKNFVDTERIFMWKSGLHIIDDYPLTGVGLKNVATVYSRYKMPGAVREHQGHLHNNFIQITAERGIFGLAAFIVLLIACYIKGFRVFSEITVTQRYEKALLLGCLGSLTGFIVSGLTEYNYGDWEILALFWFIMGIIVWLEKEEVYVYEEKRE